MYNSLNFVIQEFEDAKQVGCGRILSQNCQEKTVGINGNGDLISFISAVFT